MTPFSPRFHLAGTAPGRQPPIGGGVLVALAGPAAMRALVADIGLPARVFVGTRGQLLAAVREAPPAVLVLPADGHDGMATAGLAAQLQVEVPRLAVLVVSDTALHGRHARALRAAGARMVTTAHAPAAVSDALGAAMMQAAEPRDLSLHEALASIADASLRELLDEAVGLPPAAITPLMLAQLMGMRYRTFCRHCTEAGWPSPGRLLLLARLLRLSVAPGPRLSARAAVAGFRSPRAARLALKRLMPTLPEGVVPGPVALLRAAGLLA